jgi:hypothetical protein
LIHPDVQSAYDDCEKAGKAKKQPEQAIWKSLQTAFLRARASAQFADPVPGRAIPTYFRDRYGIVNLYCVDLAHSWRGFYTIEGRSVVFLDFVDHAKYDEWFPNKGK